MREKLYSQLIGGFYSFLYFDKEITLGKKLNIGHLAGNKRKLRKLVGECILYQT